MESTMEERYYTLQEVADRLKVNYRTVYRWVHEGTLPAYQVGQFWRVSESDFREFMEARKNKGEK